MATENPELPEGIVDGITWDEMTKGKWLMSWWTSTDGWACLSTWLPFDTVNVDYLSTKKALRKCARYKAWKLAQAIAKIKELRELLRELEWVHNIEWSLDACPVCDCWEPEPHAPDCWLKAEIDQLEPEEGG